MAVLQRAAACRAFSLALGARGRIGQNIQQAKAGAESAIRGWEVGWSVAVGWAEAGHPTAGEEAR